MENNEENTPEPALINIVNRWHWKFNTALPLLRVKYYAKTPWIFSSHVIYSFTTNPPPYIFVCIYIKKTPPSLIIKKSYTLYYIYPNSLKREQQEFKSSGLMASSLSSKSTILCTFFLIFLLSNSCVNAVRRGRMTMTAVKQLEDDVSALALRLLQDHKEKLTADRLFFAKLPKGVLIPPSAPSKRHNSEPQDWTNCTRRMHDHLLIRIYTILFFFL